MPLDQHSSPVLCVSAAGEQSPVGGMLSGIEGLLVETVASGAGCFASIRAASYSAVIANFPLPDCNADEFLEGVRLIDVSLPVVIHDAAGTVEDAVRLTKAGAYHFFGANVDPDQLTKQIEAAGRLGSAFRPSSAAGTAPAWRKFLVGNSRMMERVFHVISWSANGDVRC